MLSFLPTLQSARRSASTSYTPQVFLVCGLLLVLSICWIPATKSLEHWLPSQEASHQSSGKGPPVTVREGTELINQVGEFRLAGDRVMFYPSEGLSRFVVLENLNLQRIVKTIAENPAPLRWSVTGIATEYHGSNYLLVRAAIVESEAETREDFLVQPGNPGEGIAISAANAEDGG